MDSKVIYRGDMLRLMNKALKTGCTVTFKAYKLGKGPDDPERGEIRTYEHVKVTSHTHSGTYRVLDELTDNEKYKHRNVNEAFICEFNGKKVIW